MLGSSILQTHNEQLDGAPQRAATALPGPDAAAQLNAGPKVDASPPTGAGPPGPLDAPSRLKVAPVVNNMEVHAHVVSRLAALRAARWCGTVQRLAAAEGIRLACLSIQPAL